MIKTPMIAALLAAAAISAPAAPAFAQTDAAQPALSEAALRFGALYVPVDLGIESAIVNFDKEFGPAVRADPNVVALDQRFPGLIDAASKAGRGTMERILRARLPEAQRRVAAFAAARLTPAELDVANAYLASPAGQELQRVMAETADASALAQAARETGEPPKLDGQQLMAMVDPAILTRLSKPSLAALIEFSATPAGKKFNTSGGAFAQMVASEMNILIELMKPDIEQAVVGAITAHLGQK
ncbi:MAG: hypothetical protein H2056_05525 [Sphingopyxis sp.]|nr:hypothetical protein [Sphingopyxis sp.]